MKSIFSDDYRRVIKTLKEARQVKGLTQKELSEKLGHTQSYVSKVEQGQIRLDIVQLKKIAEVLGRDVKGLL